jgi:hypothetical protein
MYTCFLGGKHSIAGMLGWLLLTSMFPESKADVICTLGAWKKAMGVGAWVSLLITALLLILTPPRNVVSDGRTNLLQMCWTFVQHHVPGSRCNTAGLLLPTCCLPRQHLVVCDSYALLVEGVSET